MDTTMGNNPWPHKGGIIMPCSMDLPLLNKFMQIPELKLWLDPHW